MTEPRVRNYALKVFSDVFREVLHSSLGEATGEAILFFLNREMGRDPFEVLWEEPQAFYNGVERILGSGLKVLFRMLVLRINSRFGLDMSPERFLELMQSNDRSSVEELRSLLKMMAELCRSRVGGV